MNEQKYVVIKSMKTNGFFMNELFSSLIIELVTCILLFISSNFVMKVYLSRGSFGTLVFLYKIIALPSLICYFLIFISSQILFKSTLLQHYAISKDIIKMKLNIPKNPKQVSHEFFLEHSIPFILGKIIAAFISWIIYTVIFSGIATWNQQDTIPPVIMIIIIIIQLSIYLLILKFQFANVLKKIIKES